MRVIAASITVVALGIGLGVLLEWLTRPAKQPRPRGPVGTNGALCA